MTRLLSLCFALPLLAACTQAPEPPLLLGANGWPGYKPFYLARSLGYFDDRTVRLVDYPNSSSVIRNFQNGDIQAAAVTLDEALLIRENIPDAAIVLVLDISHGGDAVLAKPEIAQLRDLKGRRVGVEKSAEGSYLLTLALQHAGLASSEIRIVPLTTDAHEKAFRDGRVDAVATFEPVRGKLLAAGAHVLFDSSQAPGKIMDVLVTRRDYAERHRDRLILLARAWFRALDYLHDHTGDALLRMEQHEKIDTEEFLTAMKGLRIPPLEENRALFRGNPPPLLESARGIARFLHDNGLLAAEPDLSRFLDPGVLEARIP